MVTSVIIITVAAILLSPFIVAGILLFPHARLVFLRRTMLREIYRAAEKASLRVIPLRRFVSCSPNRSDTYDLLLQSKTHVIAIKLWSAIKPESTLVIRRDGTLCEGTAVPEPMHADSGKRRIVKGSFKSVPITRQSFTLPKGSKLETVLLYYPQNKRAIIDLDGEKRSVSSGQRLFGKTVFAPEDLIERIESGIWS